MSTRKRQKVVQQRATLKTLGDLASYLSDSQSRVVFVTGAGLSAASGLPLFRRSKNAVWEKHLMSWGTKRKFKRDPLTWYNDFWLPNFGPHVIEDVDPNGAHVALAQIMACCEPGRVHIITQNVDRLHLKDQGKVKEEYLAEVHGFVNAYRCSSAARKCPGVGKDLIYMSEPENQSLVTEKSLTDVPKCPKCGGNLMPHPLLFDEAYEDHVAFRFEDAMLWLEQATVVVFVGTSFSVGITIDALHIARDNNAVVFNINVEDPVVRWKMEVPLIHHIHGKAEEILPALYAELNALQDSRQ
eukprot:Clim_evm79s236 gene=Clim_evmTU79s236